MQNSACCLNGLSIGFHHSGKLDSSVWFSWLEISGEKPGILQKTLVICHFSWFKAAIMHQQVLFLWRKAKLLLLVVPERCYDFFCLAFKAQDCDPGSICSCIGTYCLPLLVASGRHAPETGIQQWASTGWSCCNENEASPTSTHNLER